MPSPSSYCPVHRRAAESYTFADESERCNHKNGGGLARYTLPPLISVCARIESKHGWQPSATKGWCLQRLQSSQARDHETRRLNRNMYHITGKLFVIVDMHEGKQVLISLGNAESPCEFLGVMAMWNECAGLDELPSPCKNPGEAVTLIHQRD